MLKIVLEKGLFTSIYGHLCLTKRHLDTSEGQGEVKFSLIKSCFWNLIQIKKKEFFWKRTLLKQSIQSQDAFSSWNSPCKLSVYWITIMRQIQTCSRSTLWIWCMSIVQSFWKNCPVTYKLLITYPCLCLAITGVVPIREVECEEWILLCWTIKDFVLVIEYFMWYLVSLNPLDL